MSASHCHTAHRSFILFTIHHMPYTIHAVPQGSVHVLFRTGELRKALLQRYRLDQILEEIFLVQEQKDRGALEEGILYDFFEELEGFDHDVLAAVLKQDYKQHHTHNKLVWKLHLKSTTCNAYISTKPSEMLILLWLYPDREARYMMALTSSKQ